VEVDLPLAAREARVGAPGLPFSSVSDLEAGGPGLPAVQDTDEDLPVVARLIVEVRSDGRRTIARGLVEDLATGERTMVAASGDTQMALFSTLMRAAGGLTTLARRASRVLASRRER
jgi:hypothetical protein